MGSTADRGERHEGRDGGFVAALHRFEHATGLYRPGRSPWVWSGPALNFVGSFAMVMWVGLTYDLGLATTIPTSLFLALFMGSMSAAFLATWEDEAEEDERRAADELGVPQRPPGDPGHGAERPASPAALPVGPAAADVPSAREPALEAEPEPVAPSEPERRAKPERQPVGPRGAG